MREIRKVLFILSSFLLLSPLTTPAIGQKGLSLTESLSVISSRTTSSSPEARGSARDMQVKPRRIDRYGSIPFDIIMARLDIVVTRMQEDPRSQIAIIAYGGRRGRAGEAQTHLDRVKEYLVRKRLIDEGRIQAIDGGFREDFTVEIWLVPVGATAPQPTPTVRPDQVQPLPTRTGRRRRRP